MSHSMAHFLIAVLTWVDKINSEFSQLLEIKYSVNIGDSFDLDCKIELSLSGFN